MVLDPSVSVLRSLKVVVDVTPVGHTCRLAFRVKYSVVCLSEKRVRRSELESEAEVRARTRIYLLVCRVSRKAQSIAEVVRDTCVEQEVVWPVLKLVCLPAELVVKHEEVVWPLQTVTESCRKSIYLHILVVVEDVEIEVRHRLTCIIERHAERCRLLTEKPWLGEACRKAGIIGTVGLESYGKVLGISERNRTPCALVEESSCREVVETYTDSRHECVSTPTTGEFKLA